MAPKSMGETAENIAAMMPEITREQQDAFALRSHQRAIAAIDSGKFAEEIVPVSIPQRKGRPDPGDHRRAPAPRYLPGIAGTPAPGLPQGWHGHRRQLLRPERRRGGPAADERRKSPGAGAEAAGAHPGLGGGRRPAAHHGPGAGAARCAKH